jgi:hypothetical protein
MAGRPLSSGEMGLEALEKIKRSECHGSVQLRAVKGISDEVVQPGWVIRRRCGGRGRLAM